MLSILIFLPLVAGLIAGWSGRNARTIALAAAVAEFLFSVWFALQFNATGGTQFLEDYWWVQGLGISYKVGMDGISLLLVLLTTFLTPLIILSAAGQQQERPGLLYALILVMEAALIGVFCALDGFLFYVFWELALIPIYLICLIWGGKDRLRITLKFFIYTLLGSLFMLVALIYLRQQTPAHSFDIRQLYALHLSPAEQTWIFWAFFLAFAIKMPVFPFHTWQPDTYTDSPTQGTMLLSGIMLKMGIYGLLRWLLPLAPAGVAEWGNVAMVLSVIGIVYASLIAWSQQDFKRLIAYSSIAHVGLISAGVFSLTVQGFQGSVMQMVAHGVNVVGLFFIAEILMRRTHTRELDNLGGIRNVAPQFATYFVILLLASVALPLTNGFVGEFLLLNGVYQYNAWMAAVAGLTVILGAVYMLNAYRKISLGETGTRTHNFSDLTANEKAVLIPIVAVVFITGVYPKPLLDLVEPSVRALHEIVTQSAALSLR